MLTKITDELYLDFESIFMAAIDESGMTIHFKHDGETLDLDDAEMIESFKEQARYIYNGRSK